MPPSCSDSHQLECRQARTNCRTVGHNLEAIEVQEMPTGRKVYLSGFRMIVSIRASTEIPLKVTSLRKQVAKAQVVHRGSITIITLPFAATSRLLTEHWQSLSVLSSSMMNGDIELQAPTPQSITMHDPEDSATVLANKIGRQRPSVFKSTWQEAAFVFSISMSQYLTEYYVSGFTVLIPRLIEELDIPRASSVWPATAFSLVVASTLLIFGRICDMYGGRIVFFSGLAWLTIWSVVSGFSISPIMLDLCRALQGLGAAAILPSGVMLMGSLYVPGPRKNLVFAIYGTTAVLGFFGGIVFAGIAGQLLRWSWYFWFGAIFAFVDLVASVLSVPAEKSTPVAGSSERVQMDYLGAASICIGLVLVIFAITQSAHAEQGWQTPYIPVCLALGLLALLASAYVELRVASQPLLPASLFKIPSMRPLFWGVFLLYGTWGIFSVYGILYFQEILLASPMQVVAWFVPLGIAGLLFSVLEGLILHLVPGKILLVISGLGALGSQLLLALLPMPYAGYWPWIFPATILSTIGIDISTILATVFITTSVPLSQQGLAGSVVNSVLQLGVAFSLGVSDIIQSATEDKVGLALSYKNTFWFGVALGGTGLLVLAIWADVPKASSDLTADEKLLCAQVAQAEKVEDPDI